MYDRVVKSRKKLILPELRDRWTIRRVTYFAERFPQATENRGIMTTKDLQRIDELVHSADMAVRVASQLRLWIKRHRLSDAEAVEEGVRFLDEAVCGGKFVETGEMVAGSSSSLYPLTWAADIRFGQVGQFAAGRTKSVRYDELLNFLESIKGTLSAVASDEQTDNESVQRVATFFDELGSFLGNKADNALLTPAGGPQLLHDRFSYQ